jgi:hypothetical protein
MAERHARDEGDSSAGFAGATEGFGGGFGRGAEPPSEGAAPTLLIGRMTIAGS